MHPGSSASLFALREWSSVCALLAAGEICLLLRKGGVRESSGPGVFELEHDGFLLFPALEHERSDRLKPSFLKLLPPGGVPPVPAAYARVERAWRVPSREAFDRLEDLHPWLPAHVDMRFDYKPENPLHLFALRVWRLARPVSPPAARFPGGCRSWVDLGIPGPPDLSGAVAAMSEGRLSDTLRRVEEAFGGACSPPGSSSAPDHG